MSQTLSAGQLVHPIKSRQESDLDLGRKLYGEYLHGWRQLDVMPRHLLWVTN